MTKQIIIGAIALVVGILVGAFFFGSSGQAPQAEELGSNALTTISNKWKFTNTIQVGSSGTAQSNQVTATCAAVLNSSITASSTGYGYCTGVTGVTSSDNVLAQFSTSTLGALLPAEGFWITSAKASSTSGAIDFIIYNGSGATAVPSAVGQIGSTTVIHASN